MSAQLACPHRTLSHGARGNGDPLLLLCCRQWRSWSLVVPLSKSIHYLQMSAIFIHFSDILQPLLHLHYEGWLRIAGEESSPAPWPGLGGCLYCVQGTAVLVTGGGGRKLFPPPPGAPLLVPTTVTRGGVIHQGN